MRSCSLWLIACFYCVLPAHAHETTGELGSKISFANHDQSSKKFLLHRDDLLFRNEFDDKYFNFYLAEDQIEKAELSIGLTSSIYSAPDKTVLQVEINGQPILERSPEFSASTEVFRAPVPSSHLRQGWNKLAIGIHQHHRTDCTEDSINQLWSAIDPEKTFLSYQGKAPIGASLSSRIAGLDVGKNRIFDINIQVAPALLNQLSTGEIIAHLAKALGWAHKESGVKIAINNSTGEDHKDYDLQVELAIDASISSPKVNLVDRTRNHPPVLEMTIANAQSIASLILNQDIERQGNEKLSILLDEAKALSFSSVGHDSVNIFDRKYRIPFVLQAPENFYSENYAQAAFVVTGTYSELLNNKTKFTVYVNEELASSVPLRVNLSRTLEAFPVEFPLHHIKPGHNDVVLEVQPAINNDQDCFYDSHHDELRMTLDASSSLQLPATAQMFRGVSLSTLFNNFAADQATVVGIKLPQTTDSHLYESIAEVVARIAQKASSNEFVLRLSYDEFDQPIDHVIEFTFANALGRTEAERFCLSMPRSNHGRITASRHQSSAAVEKSTMNKVSQSIQDTFNRIKPNWQCTSASIDDNARLVLAQNINTDEVPTTLLVSANSSEMIQGIRAITEDQQWQFVTEQASRLDKQGQISSYRRADIFNFSSAATSFSNFRLALANWVSGASLVYLGLMLLSSILFGIGSTRLFKAFSRDDT